VYAYKTKSPHKKKRLQIRKSLLEWNEN